MTAINFVKYLSGKRDYKTITHSQLDEWTYEDFVNRGMIESIVNMPNIHLYFDFDFHDGDNIAESIGKIIKGLDEIAVVFGEYHYAGYCTDASMYKQLGDFAKFIELKTEKLDKPLSFHVVYPTTMISRNELVDIIKSGKYTTPLGELLDDKVYKEDGKEQLMRHPYAHKYKSARVTKEDEKKGVNFNNLQSPTRPSYLVLTPCGTEKIIGKKQWLTVFTMQQESTQYQLDIKPISSDSDDDDSDGPIRNVFSDDSDWDDTIEVAEDYDETAALIEMCAGPQKQAKNTNKPTKSPTKTMKTAKSTTAKSTAQPSTTNILTSELFTLMYKGFAGLEIHGDVGDVNEEISLFPLMSALYKCIGENVTADDVDDALDFIKDNAKLTTSAREKWSDKRKQARKNDKCEGYGTLIKYLKTFNPEYFNTHIRPSVQLDATKVKFDLNDPFTIKDIRRNGVKRLYQIGGDEKRLHYNAVLCDLKRVFVYTDQDEGVFYFKHRDPKTGMNTFNILSRDAARKKLTDIHVGTEARGNKNKIISVTAYDVFNKDTNNAGFARDDVCFYINDPDVICYYQGLKYKPIQNDDLIKPFNDHIRNVICKGNDELYEYLQSWFATIIQHPLAKTTTALVIKGTEGTGKNTVTDVWCELLRGYSNANADIDAFAGKYNTGIANTKLAVFNEFASVEITKDTTLFSSLKKLITEDSFSLHAKHKNNLPNQQNVLNMIILSNEFNPVKLSSTDRRYVVLTPSEEHINDPAYFKPLYMSIKVNGGRHNDYRKDFMQALTYYYSNYNVTVDLTKIPDTEERRMLRDTNRPFTHFFIAHYIDELINGMPGNEAFDAYNNYYMFNNGYGNKLTRNKFIGCMCAEYCEQVRIKQSDGTVPRCLRLKNNAKFINDLRELRDSGDDNITSEQPVNDREQIMRQIAMLQAQLDGMADKD